MIGDRSGALLTHPVVLAALATLVVNDHLLKPWLHNAVTGKLSDIAGLVAFPVLLVSGVEIAAWALGRSVRPRRQLCAFAALATGLVFVAVQLLPAATDAYRTVASVIWFSGTASVVPDPTDLLALPAVAVGWILAGQPQPSTVSDTPPSKSGYVTV